MAKRNRLVSDVRRESDRAKKALAAVGKIGESVDQFWLAQAMGNLKEAAESLDAAANYFELHGRDYEGAGQ